MWPAGVVKLNVPPDSRSGLAHALVGMQVHLWAAAGFVDIDLSFLSLFELYGTDVAER